MKVHNQRDKTVRNRPARQKTKEGSEIVKN